MNISVVIPAYNAARFLERTIDSARAQTLAPLEIIVVDDGSKDDTAAVAAACGATVIRQQNGGVCAARNTGIMAAAGDWIALLDHDDIWTPQKLERQAAAAALRPDVACIATDFLRQRGDVLDTASCLDDPAYNLDRLTSDQLTPTISVLPHAGEEILGIGWMLMPSAMLIRRDVLITAGMFRVEQRLCEDVDCFLRVLRHTPLLMVREPLWHWREHATNTSQNTTGISEGWLQLAAYVREHPGQYPPDTLARIQPMLRTVRRDLVSVYAGNGDMRSARRVARSAMTAGRPTPSEAALAVVVEMPPTVWSVIRSARRAILSIFT